MSNQNEQLPLAFKKRMQIQLGAEAEEFFQALLTPSPVSIRLNPEKWLSSKQLLTETMPHLPIPWCKEGIYLSQRPIFTLDPCLHGGAYYVQEASSMFLSQVLQEILPKRAIRVLDLCAAPEGNQHLSPHN